MHRSCEFQGQRKMKNRCHSDSSILPLSNVSSGNAVDSGPEQEQPPQLPESLPDVAKVTMARFAVETSAHGYRNLVGSSQPSLRLIWLLFIVGALCGMTFHLNLIATQYFAYNKRVLTEKTVEALRFPTLILCTSNFWSDFLMEQPAGSRFKQLRQSIINTSTSLFPDYADFQLEQFVDQMLLDKYFDAKRTGEEFLDLLQMTLSLEAVLLACQFNFQPCDASNFTPVATQEYGFCFTFSPSPPLASQFGSYNNGLMLTLALETSNSSNFANEPSMTFTRGYIVKLVPHGVYANTYRLPPFGVPVSFQTGIGMTAERTQRLQSSVSPCASRQFVADAPMSAGVVSSSEYSYSLVTCVDMKLSMHIYKTCGCVSSSLPVSAELANQPHCLAVANLSSTADVTKAFVRYNCALYELHSHSEASAYTHFIDQCITSCLDIDIRVTTTYTLLPTWNSDLLEYIKYRVDNLTDTGAQNFLSELYNLSLSEPSYMLDRIGQLNVYYKASTLDTFKEDWQYPIESFLSEAGGVVGLWTGASVLTVVEVMELFSQLMRLLCVARRRQLTVRSTCIVAKMGPSTDGTQLPPVTEDQA